MKKLFDLKPSEAAFLLTGILLQVITYVIAGDTVLSFVSGLAGACSVVLCSQRKIISYLFGFIQIITYAIITYRNRYYGGIAQNVFYFVTMVVGLILWLKNYDADNNKVEARALSWKGWLICLSTLFMGILSLYFILQKTNDSQPLIDSISTMPAFIAQILMITRFKEQWYFWIIVDIATLILWINAKDWCMAMQYAFWTITCVYGLHQWSEE